MSGSAGMDIARALPRIAGGDSLSSAQTEALFDAIMQGDSAPAAVGGLLIALKMKGESIDELAGAARSLRKLMHRVAAPPSAIDTCGTGGDGLSTLNISTATAIVTAACGLPMAKHGNRSATSRSSSAGVLEELGVAVDLGAAAISRCLNEVGIGFMLANSYHPAMGAVAPVRKALGVPTLFNLLGPICNPAMVQRQMTGVFARQWVEPMARTLAMLGSDRAWVVHGAGGMDELSLAGPSLVAQLAGGKVTMAEISPADAGLAEAPVSAVQGGDVRRNAQAILDLLDGRKDAYRDSVIYNAAGALTMAQDAPDLRAGAAMAAEAIDSGRAGDTFSRWRALTQALANTEAAE